MALLNLGLERTHKFAQVLAPFKFNFLIIELVHQLNEVAAKRDCAQNLGGELIHIFILISIILPDNFPNFFIVGCVHQHFFDNLADFKSCLGVLILVEKENFPRCCCLDIFGWLTWSTNWYLHQVVDHTKGHSPFLWRCIYWKRTIDVVILLVEVQIGCLPQLLENFAPLVYLFWVGGDYPKSQFLNDFQAVLVLIGGSPEHPDVEPCGHGGPTVHQLGIVLLNYHSCTLILWKALTTFA